MRLIAVLILCSWIGSGQAQNLKQCLKYGEEGMQAGDYHQAITFYEKALQYDSASIDILYKYAGALYAYNYYPKALYYYDKVAGKGNGKIYPESIYYKAMLQKNLGQYREAIDTWKKVKKVL
jgi:tetratricopeptide (TPR) repeat protein